MTNEYAKNLYWDRIIKVQFGEFHHFKYTITNIKMLSYMRKIVYFMLIVTVIKWAKKEWTN